MSFYVFTDSTHSHIVKAIDVKTARQKASNYCCPGCTATFRFRSESSNGTPAHFYLFHDNHDASCWVPYAGKAVNKMLSKPDKSFDADSFLDELIAKGVKAPTGTTGKHHGGRKKILHLSTVRNLYKYCLLHPDTAMVNDTKRIKDLFVGRKTKYLYTRHISGIKLIEAKYWRYTKTQIFLKYPYGEDPHKFTIRLDFNGDERLCATVRNRIYGVEKPVLIYAEWITAKDEVSTTILNEAQVVLSTR